MPINTSPFLFLLPLLSGKNGNRVHTFTNLRNSFHWFHKLHRPKKKISHVNNVGGFQVAFLHVMIIREIKAEKVRRKTTSARDHGDSVSSQGPSTHATATCL